MRARTHVTAILAALSVFTLALGTCTQPLLPVTWTAAQKAAIQTAIAQVSAVEVRSLLSDLDVIRHVTQRTPGELAALEDAIAGRLNAYGLSTQRLEVTTDRVWWWNQDGDYIGSESGTFRMNDLIGTRTGLDPDLPPVLVTAHWDTMPNTVGMDDNASGTAGVVEVARVLQGLDLDRTVVFAVFAFEEEGLLGSAAYARTMSGPPHAVINLEMIGFTSADQDALPLTDLLLDFPTVGDFIGVVGSDFSKALALSFCTVAAEYSPDLPTYMIGADQNLQNDPFLRDFLRSDHTPFWEQGVPAIMVTDTSFLREGSAYHTPQDTLDKLDLAFMVEVIRTVAALTCLEAGLR